MTEPRDPGGVGEEESSGSQEPRGRHWAPDDEAGGTDASAGGDTSAPDGNPDDDPATEESAEPAEMGDGPHGIEDPLEPEHDGRPVADEVPADSEAMTESPEHPDSDLAPDTAEPLDTESEVVPPVDGARSGPRHAAAGSALRLQPWMVTIIVLVVVGLLAWLVIALVSGGDDEQPPTPTTSASTETNEAPPEPVDPASLPQVLCMGQSYLMIDTGQPIEALLADPAAVEAQYPGSKLSTIPPGCLADIDERDQVVLALGPFPDVDEACDAGRELEVTFQAYAGSADTGLTPTSCPDA